MRTSQPMRLIRWLVLAHRYLGIAIGLLMVMWCLSGIGALDEAWLVKQFGHAEEHVRAWAIRLAIEEWGLDGKGKGVLQAVHEDLVELARSDSSPVVRLALASGCQRLPHSQRWGTALVLARTL